MNTYKLIKRKDNVKYYLGINKVNSRTGTIFAEWVKLKETDIAGTVDLKTHKITLAEGYSSLPDEVVEALQSE